MNALLAETKPVLGPAKCLRCGAELTTELRYIEGWGWLVLWVCPEPECPYERVL